MEHTKFRMKSSQNKTLAACIKRLDPLESCSHALALSQCSINTHLYLCASVILLQSDQTNCTTHVFTVNGWDKLLQPEWVAICKSVHCCITTFKTGLVSIYWLYRWMCKRANFPFLMIIDYCKCPETTLTFFFPFQSKKHRDINTPTSYPHTPQLPLTFLSHVYLKSVKECPCITESSGSYNQVQVGALNTEIL